VLKVRLKRIFKILNVLFSVSGGVYKRKHRCPHKDIPRFAEM